MEQSQDGQAICGSVSRGQTMSELEASGAVNATKSECSALPQNGTENDEPESFQKSEN